MNIIDKISDYHQKENDLKQEALNIKKEFEIYIKDKSIPIIDRWKFFIHASDNLKNHEEWCIRPNSLGLSLFIDKFSNSPEYYRRGKQFFTADVMKEFVAGGKLHGGKFEDPYYDSDYEDEGYEEDQEYMESLNKSLTEALEEILAKNIGSFVYDW